ncbi:MAG: threonine-phosphate decarboxylase [Xanthobacteraceae bacterium]|nr:threonine-phosphate decarboxylase [Xanthobacteraceae bacterium]
MGLARLSHGGDLAAARRQFPDAPEPLIDLSTGINPHPYPLPPLRPPLFARLPEPDALERLAATAARAYEVAADQVVAAPGTQSLLAPVFALAAPGRAAILGPTYAEHARVAALVGHRVEEVTTLDALADADIAVVVNPNNPDGRLTSRKVLLALVEEKRRRGGLLVVDEAFAEVGPAGLSIAAQVGGGGLVVLRSFGKFYGLAGLRLGFALAAAPHAARLRAMLGPWPVSGPALAAGEAALADAEWTQAMREVLARDAARLDGLLSGAGLEIGGGTSLFRLVHTPAAATLADHLGRAGIVVRRFPEAPKSLRFGLPGNDAAWERLTAALGGFATVAAAPNSKEPSWPGLTRPSRS